MKLRLYPRKSPSTLLHKDLWIPCIHTIPCYITAMSNKIDLLGSIKNMMSFCFGVICYLGRFLLLLITPKAVLAAKVLALQSQLVSCVDSVNRKKAPKPRFSHAFRFLWAFVITKLLDNWREFAHVMKPKTVIKWHKAGFKLYWPWKSKQGRPVVSREMQALIRRLSRENPLWGAERIREELAKLQYDPPCEDSVRKYMVKTTNPRERSSTWLPFLRNHLDEAWAMDFATLTTLTFQRLYVFVIIEHGNRKIRYWVTTYNPTMEWVLQQLRESMPWGEQPRFMHRDNNSIYGNGVPTFLKNCGIEEVRTAYHCPWQNPYIERFNGTLRRELFDHVIPLSQSHVERLLCEYIENYYQVERPHQGLNGRTPVPCELYDISGPTKLESRSVLGGLHHTYHRVAA